MKYEQEQEAINANHESYFVRQQVALINIGQLQTQRISLTVFTLFGNKEFSGSWGLC